MDTPDDKNPSDDSNEEEGPKKFERREGKDRQPISDDFEINELEKLGYEEVERISKDPDDSRQEKAQELLRLRADVWAKAVTPLFKGINEQYADLWKNIIGQSMPKFDMSQHIPKFDLPLMKLDISPRGSARESPAPDPRELAPAPEAVATSEEILHVAREATSAILQTNARLTEMVQQSESGAVSTAALMVETNRRLEEMLNQARDEAREQKLAAEKSDGHAVKARHQTWWVIGFTVAVGVAQILVAVLPRCS